jgi:hypothetical protein
MNTQNHDEPLSFAFADLVLTLGDGAHVQSLTCASTAGVQETVPQLGFAQLATLPVQDICAALVDVICEPGGELDESFAREAYIKALTEISGARADLERPSSETSASFLASFVTNLVTRHNPNLRRLLVRRDRFGHTPIIRFSASSSASTFRKLLLRLRAGYDFSA